jgi:hypothetical protein
MGEAATHDEIVLECQVVTASLDFDMHFAFEEQNGYMTSVVDLQPHLTRAVDRLQQEHEELLATLDSLIAEVRVAGLSDDLRNRVGLWLKAIRRHELSENVLMQDAFSLDLGSKD